MFTQSSSLLLLNVTGPRAAPPTGRVSGGGRGQAGRVRRARARVRAEELLPRAARATTHLRPVRRLHTRLADL